MQYQKVQSVAKMLQVKGPELDRIVLQTMETISNIVGATLGPGGRQVIIERQEFGLPPMVTKDGVTVFSHLGFDDPRQQAIMEAARDASVRTASEAGDGTTTATILAEAIVRLIKKYTEVHKRESPQRVVRRLEHVFKTVVEPTLIKLAVRADLTTQDGREMLQNVAKISANGDLDLAKAVIECFDIVGDDGNVTIAELNGPSRYEVEKIEGFPIGIGFEESAARFYPKFINDPGNQRVLLTKPRFVLYHGRIQDPQSLFLLLSKIGNAFEAGQIGANIVLVSTGFSENVLGYLGTMFQADGALNVFPLLVPQSPFPNGQLEFLQDLAAVTGSEVLDPLNLDFEHADLSHFGSAETFEAFRFRSNVVGKPPSEDALMLRVDQLQTNLGRAESKLDSISLQERIGKLTGGIARLKVIGVSNGELKEKRDRAEDAVCAVRGAIKYGVLPGGCWALLRLQMELIKLYDPIVNDIMIPAFFEPLKRLLENMGLHESEFDDVLKPIRDSLEREDMIVYDALESKHVDPFIGGILDSLPAVLEAIRNSLGIAALLGTLGGAVVYKRNSAAELQEARDQANFLRDANRNEADERA